MKRVLRIPAALTALAGFLVFVTGPATAAGDQIPVILAAAQGTLQPAQVTANGVTKTMPFFSNSAIASAQEVLNKAPGAPAGPAPETSSASSDSTLVHDELGISPSSYGCG